MKRASLIPRVARWTPVPLRRYISRARRMLAESGERKQQERIRGHVYGVTKGTVAQGPFTGLKLVDRQSWTSPVPTLVGSYESELHMEIERLVSERPRIVIDVGCAEGYYAVGTALRLSSAIVYAYDIDPSARKICRETGALNGVSERLVVRGSCAPSDLAALAGPDVLLIVDCEGYEVDLLKPDLAPGLIRTTILVELHDFIDPTITATILGRFAATHKQVLVDSGKKDLAHWTALRGLSAGDQRAAVDERRPLRPHPMQWAVLRPN